MNKSNDNYASDLNITLNYTANTWPESDHKAAVVFFNKTQLSCWPES